MENKKESAEQIAEFHDINTSRMDWARDEYPDVISKIKKKLASLRNSIA